MFKLVQAALKEFREVTGAGQPSVVGVEVCDQGWRITVEVVEKSSIPASMDLLGIYALIADDQGDLANFSRVGLRRRGDARAS